MTCLLKYYLIYLQFLFRRDSIFSVVILGNLVMMRIESEEIYDDEGLYCWIVRDVAYSIYEVEKNDCLSESEVCDDLTWTWISQRDWCAHKWLNVIPESDRNWVFFATVFIYISFGYKHMYVMYINSVNFVYVLHKIK